MQQEGNVTTSPKHQPNHKHFNCDVATSPRHHHDISTTSTQSQTFQLRCHDITMTSPRHSHNINPPTNISATTTSTQPRHRHDITTTSPRPSECRKSEEKAVGSSFPPSFFFPFFLSFLPFVSLHRQDHQEIFLLPSHLLSSLSLWLDTWLSSCHVSPTCPLLSSTSPLHACL